MPAGGRQKVIVCHDFWATVCSTVRPMPSDHCLSCLSVTLVYCGQTVGHIVLDPAPSPPKGHTPHFSAHVCCGAGWIKMAFGREVGLGLGDIVLDGDPAPTSHKGGSSAPHFSAHVYCDQTVDGSRCHSAPSPKIGA